MAPDPLHQNALDDLARLLDRFAGGSQPIIPTTELYYDLRLAGDDLYEVLAEVRERFGTDFSKMDVRDYAPGETEAMFSLDGLRELLGRPRRYRSLTVQLLAEAIQAGCFKGN